MTRMRGDRPRETAIERFVRKGCPGSHFEPPVTPTTNDTHIVDDPDYDPNAPYLETLGR